MRRPQFSLKTLLWLMAVVAAVPAATAADDAIKYDRKQMEGTWRVVTVVFGGEKPDDDFKKEELSVTFGADGKWKLTLDADRVASGSSTINPATRPKTIDLETGDGTIYLGIYQFTEKVHLICFSSPDHERPTEFSSKPDTKNILIEFERKR